jgi:hypothetical protein
MRTHISAVPADTGLADKKRPAPLHGHWLRLGATAAATALLSGLGMVAAAAPASAVTITYSCSLGHYNPANGALRGQECGDAGSASNIYVLVSVLDSPNGPEDDSATLFCTTFTVQASGAGSGLCGPPVYN